jgi:hypothetical protein
MGKREDNKNQLEKNVNTGGQLKKAQKSKKICLATERDIFRLKRFPVNEEYTVCIHTVSLLYLQRTIYGYKVYVFLQGAVVGLTCLSATI